MSSTGTFTFNPAASDLVVTAYGRIGVRANQISTQHLFDAATEANLLMVEWSNRQPNLWTSDTQTIATVAGTATYTLPAETISPLIVYLRTGSGTSAVDYVMSPISTVDYSSIANKAQTGSPNQYWFNRQTVPQLTIWPVPTVAGTLIYQRVRQLQDVSITNGTTLDTPYRWLDAFTAGLAYRVSRIWARPLTAECKGEYDEAWAMAANEDQENVPMMVSPQFVGYYQ